MKTISGTVCILTDNGQKTLFGKRSAVAGSPGKYEELLTNGLKPFPKKDTAIRAKGRIQKTYGEAEVAIALFKLEIYEKESEWIGLKHVTDLVVIAALCNPRLKFEIFGAAQNNSAQDLEESNGNPHAPPPFVQFSDPAFQVFSDFDYAHEAMLAIRDRTDVKSCALATFDLRSEPPQSKKWLSRVIKPPVK